MKDKTSDKLTKEKIERYLDITKKAIRKVKPGSTRKFSWKDASEDFLDMATRYYRDALHFRDRRDLVNAFAAVNYAHGWLDAGARLGLFDVDGDSELFTVDKEMFAGGFKTGGQKSKPAKRS